MADKKITALADLGTAVIGTDIIHIIDDPAGTPVNKKISIDSLMKNMPSVLAFDSTPQALTATTGTVDATSAVTTMATGGASAYGMANGTVGQIKILTMITDGGDAVVTPTLMANGTTLTFADAGDSATLMWVATGWMVVGSHGPGTPGAGPTTA